MRRLRPMRKLFLSDSSPSERNAKDEEKDLEGAQQAVFENFDDALGDNLLRRAKQRTLH